VKKQSDRVQANPVQTNQVEITQQSQQRCRLSGILNFSTVPDLMKRMKAIFLALSAAGNSKLVIDFSQITQCNSAALAWMLASVEQARLKNITLHFENLPMTLLIIAKAYGVEDEIKHLTVKL
jgi:ABC-type transporter Mla MlaB component